MRFKKIKLFFIFFLVFFNAPEYSFALTSKECTDLHGQKFPKNTSCPSSLPNSSGALAAPFFDFQCCLKQPPPDKQKLCYNNADEVIDCASTTPRVSDSDCGAAFGGIAIPNTRSCPDSNPFFIGPISSSLQSNLNCCGSREKPLIPQQVQIEGADKPKPQSFNPNLQYSLLEKLPGISGTEFSLPEYIAAVYKLAIWIVGLSALFMFLLGAFMYMLSAGNTSKMGSGKDIMQDALIGLVLALASYLILYVINPDLLKLKLSSLSLSSQGAQEQAASPTSVSIPVPGDMKSAAAQILSNGKITLATNGSCRSESGPVTPRKNMEDIAAGKSMDGCYSGCNAPNAKPCNLRINPSENMLDAILIVSQKYAISITSFSGGSHSKTSRHYSGRATDLTSGNKSDWPGIVAEFKKNGASQAFCDKNGNQVSCDSADHIHVGY